MRFVLVAALLTAATPAQASEFAGTITKVIDGDTFDVRTPSGKVRIRFCGIDTPERGWGATDLFEMHMSKSTAKIPLGYVEAKICRQCGDAAHIVRCAPVAPLYLTEIQTFECATCGTQSEVWTI